MPSSVTLSFFLVQVDILMESPKVSLPPPRQLAASKGSMQQRIRKRTEETEANLVNVVHTLPACCRCRTVCLQFPPSSFACYVLLQSF